MLLELRSKSYFEFSRFGMLQQQKQVPIFCPDRKVIVKTKSLLLLQHVGSSFYHCIIHYAVPKVC